MTEGLDPDAQTRRTQEGFGVNFEPFTSPPVDILYSITKAAVDASASARVNYYHSEYHKELKKLSNTEPFNELTLRVDEAAKKSLAMLNPHSIIPFNEYLDFVNNDILYIVQATNLVSSQIAHKEIAEAIQTKIKAGLLSNEEGDNLLTEADEILFIKNGTEPLSQDKINKIKEGFLECLSP